ncbi:hypothetical protein ACJX0J_018179 [Zea mays]
MPISIDGNHLARGGGGGYVNYWRWSKVVELNRVGINLYLNLLKFNIFSIMFVSSNILYVYMFIIITMLLFLERDRESFMRDERVLFRTWLYDITKISKFIKVSTILIDQGALHEFIWFLLDLVSILDMICYDMISWPGSNNPTADSLDGNRHHALESLFQMNLRHYIYKSR